MDLQTLKELVDEAVESIEDAGGDASAVKVVLVYQPNYPLLCGTSDNAGLAAEKAPHNKRQVFCIGAGGDGGYPSNEQCAAAWGE